MNTNKNMMNAIERNETAKQYFPLVMKIANQLCKSTGYDLDMARSAGNEGLIWAMDSYDPSKQVGKKKQSFTQYAAYMIRGYILNDINAHGHTIRVNQDQQKKLKAEGKSVNLTTSLDKTVGGMDDERCTLANVVVGDTASDIYASLDPSVDELWKEIYESLNKVFSERDLDIFYSTFALNDHEEKDGKEMAKKYKVSAAAITQVRNKIVKYMKNDKVLREKLLDILQLSSAQNYAL